MSRSAADATRFTATGPYANARPAYKLPDFMKSPASRNGNDSRPGHNPGPGQGPGPGPGQGQGPPGETPKQKVERLRAQARARHTGSSLDRMIEVGREMANKAHKVMVYSLITASGVCGALTVYSIISLTLYNRRQRTLWLQNELHKLETAKVAHAAGTATPEQTEIIKNEIVGEMMKKQKAHDREQRPWNRAKRYLLGGLKEEEDSPVGDALPALTQSQAGQPATGQVQSHTGQTQTAGQLDILANNAETAAKETTKSWTSWLKFR